jgi:hypothetical protein
MNFGERIDFEGIRSAALRAARSLLPELLPGGKFEGGEYVVRNPLRDDRTAGSFKINSRTGVWKDFATEDDGSDLISRQKLVFRCRNCLARPPMQNRRPWWCQCPQALRHLSRPIIPWGRQAKPGHTTTHTAMRLVTCFVSIELTARNFAP